MVIRSVACLDVKRDLYWGDTISTAARAVWLCVCAWVCMNACLCVCVGVRACVCLHKLRQAGIFSVGQI